MDKRKNALKIFIMLLCLCAVGVFALAESGADVPFLRNYKNNFKKNINGICQMLKIDVPIEMQLYLDDMSTPTPMPTMIPADEQKEMNAALGYPQPEKEIIVPKEGTVALTTKQPINLLASQQELPIAFDAASNARFSAYKNYFICATETNYMAYDRKGVQLWKDSLQMQQPILKVKGDYILLAEQGAKKINLYKGKKLLFGTKTAGNIVTADLSENGDIIAVTDKEYYKGQVVVYNKKGERIFAWDSGSYNILDAAISDSRHVAVSLLNTDSGADSFITCFDVDGKERFKTPNFKSMIIFALEYNGETISAFSDTKCMGISAKGKVSWEYDYAGKNIMHYGTAENGAKLLLFDNENTGELAAISASGHAYDPIKAESMPDCIDINSGSIAYNNGRDIIMKSLNGRNTIETTCDSDIKQIHILDSKYVLAIYSSSIQVKKLAKPEKEETVQAPVTPSASTAPAEGKDK